MGRRTSVFEEVRKGRSAPSSTVIGAQNIPASGPVILVANHISESDAELLKSTIRRAVHFENVTARLLQNELVAIFPEGSPSRTGSIESFGPEIEAIIAANPNAVIIPVSICRASAEKEPIVLIGVPLKAHLTAAQLRQKVVELSCEAIEHCQALDSTLTYRLIETARRNWNKPAIADLSQRYLAYGEMLTQALLMSDCLRRRACAGEQNIGVYLPASVDAVIANCAISLAGKTAVNLNFTAGEQNCRLAAQLCGIRTILTSRSFLQRVGLEARPEMMFLEDVRQQFTTGDKEHAHSEARFTSSLLLTQDVFPGSIACILFSSGSTGIPKGIELTHWNILSNADGLTAKIRPAAEDCMLGVLPFFHSFGYTFALWFPILQGFRAAYHASPTDAQTIGDLAEAHRATFFLSTPTFCLQYARKIKPEQFASLKYIIVGAEKLRDSVADEFRRHFGIGLLAGYGCTELGPGVAINSPDVVDSGGVHHGTRCGSVGRPLSGIAIRIVDPETYAPVPIGSRAWLW
jgi:acyl-[acyl-carrier-protein]-phospholipid O-acyltransferase / long-chain-fatty-acid--[acyl-carrier-protein] ligase